MRAHAELLPTIFELCRSGSDSDSRRLFRFTS
jgi:hypothetical protein